MDVRVTNNFGEVRVEALSMLAVTRQRLAIGLDVVGMKAIDHATSFTGKFSPPVGRQKVKRGGHVVDGKYVGGYDATYISPRGRSQGPRPQHPGGWADDRIIAARSYEHEVGSLAGLLILEVRNVAEHSIHLENRGYGVIGFLFESFIPREVRKMVQRIEA